MPWCPKCRRFQEEDDLCAHCWVETVDELAPETNRHGPNSEALLTTVANLNEANIIESILTTDQIPVLKKHRGSGEFLQVYMGMSSTGIDIFVPVSKLDRAQALIEGYREDFDLDSMEIDMSETDETSDVEPVEYVGDVEYDDNDSAQPVFGQRQNQSRVLLTLFLSIIIIALIMTLWFSID